MKSVLTLACVLLLAGCASMTPGQKRAAAIVGGALVVGAAAAHGSNGNALQQMPDKPCPSGGAKSGVIYHC